MANYRDYIRLIFIVVILDISSVYSARSCRCVSNNATCWPNLTAWQTLNISVDGRLLIPHSSAAPCTRTQFDETLCNDAYTNWFNSIWRSDQVGAMQYFNWENTSCSIFNINSTCTQGSTPVFAVNATLPEHVQATIRFATTNNLRLVIKTTGHDMLGRSTAPGSLLLWLHHMKNMTLTPQYLSCKGENILNVVRLGGGIQWGEVYSWLANVNLTVIGGTCSSVGAVGGYIQGGGHSSLARWAGMATDQVLEYDVITADGQRQVVSACQNGDLFWALGGGGGGTYAVVLSVVLRTFNSPYIIGSIQNFVASNETRYAQLIRDFVAWLPTLADVGWAGYFTMVDTNISITLLWPNGNFDIANAMLNQFMDNNSDLYFSTTGAIFIPSFYEAYRIAFESTNPTGFNTIMSSRLIPETIVRNRPNDVADTFVRMKGQNSLQSKLLGHLIAGGQASNMSKVNNSVNPAWRTALLHMGYGRVWPAETSPRDLENIATQITRQGQLLDILSNDTEFGSYMNEADPNEPNWQRKFFGSQSMYDRLKNVKQKVDPNGLFVCRNCVGSDDWTADLNCPILNQSNLVNINFVLLILLTGSVLLKDSTRIFFSSSYAF